MRGIRRAIRRSIFRLVLLLFLFLLVEGVSWCAFYLLDKRSFTYDRIFDERKKLAGPWRKRRDFPEKAKENQDRIAQAQEDYTYLKTEAVHPYLGFVLNPASNSPSKTRKWGGQAITEYGFIGEPGLFPEPSEDSIKIGIFGGSVAAQFCDLGADALLAGLEESTVFEGKKVELIRIALGGFKQPQQLMALNYFLVLGFHFDLVINIDGFNEVALPTSENIPQQVAPVFPRTWYWRVQSVPDEALKKAMGELSYLTSEQRRIAELFSRRPYVYSPTWNLVWRIRNARLGQRIFKASHWLETYDPDLDSFQAQGPYREYPNEQELYADLARIWSRSSLQMHGLCHALGIPYLHFLQPNQYVPDSKEVVSAAERQQAFSEKSPFAHAVKEGYPHLLEEGRALLQEGVSFHDLTMIFREVGEAIYNDNCCHFNESGNEIMAEVMLDVILEELRGARLGARQ